MRNHLVILSAVALAFSAAACGDSSDSADHRMRLGGSITLYDQPGGRGVEASFTEETFEVDDGEVALDECRTVERITWVEPEFLDAGPTLTLFGGGREPLPLYRGVGHYLPQPATGYQWLEGLAGSTAYSLSGNGGDDVGALATALLMPANVRLDAPRADDMRRDEPLTVAWTSTNQAEPVFVSISQDVWDGNDIVFEYQALCKFEDDGFATIPTSVVARLRADLPGYGELDDQIWTYVQVAKRNVNDLQPLGASGTVRATSEFRSYGVNYVK